MTTASARHILVDDEAACNDLKSQIEGGADFAALAAEHSKCPSGQRGGDLGTFSRGQMVPEFDTVVFNDAGVVRLTMVFVPEPSTVGLLSFAMGVLFIIRKLRTGEPISTEFFDGLNAVFVAEQQEQFAMAKVPVRRVKRYKYRRPSQNEFLRQ